MRIYAFGENKYAIDYISEMHKTCVFFTGIGDTVHNFAL